jgi:hypothetical protein
MKAKNQTERSLLELAITKAANEEGLSPASSAEANTNRKQAWSPLEVWRTRVKASAPIRTKPAQI